MLIPCSKVNLYQKQSKLLKNTNTEFFHRCYAFWFIFITPDIWNISPMWRPPRWQEEIKVHFNRLHKSIIILEFYISLTSPFQPSDQSEFRLVVSVSFLFLGKFIFFWCFIRYFLSIISYRNINFTRRVQIERVRFLISFLKERTFIV